jgi:hypothetical protein
MPTSDLALPASLCNHHARCAHLHRHPFGGRRRPAGSPAGRSLPSRRVERRCCRFARGALSRAGMAHPDARNPGRAPRRHRLRFYNAHTTGCTETEALCATARRRQSSALTPIIVRIGLADGALCQLGAGHAAAGSSSGLSLAAYSHLSDPLGAPRDRRAPVACDACSTSDCAGYLLVLYREY